MSKPTILGAATCAGLLLAGFVAGSSPQDPGPAQAITGPVTLAGKAADRIVRSPGKLGAPVDLAWHVTSKPAPGAPVLVNLNLLATAAVEQITLQVTPGPGLEGSKGHGEIALRGAAAGDRQDHGVVVVPDREGTLYLHVVALVQTLQGRQVRTFAVPVVVGDAGAGARDKSAGRLRQGADGERVVVLPARETDRTAEALP